MDPLEALKRGEEEAIHWLVDSFSQRLLKAATLMLGDEHLAEDAVQDCLLDAVSHLPNFRGDSSLYTWLYTILLHRCNRLRKRRWRQIVQSPEEVGRLLPEGIGSTSVSDRGEGQVLRQAITSLNYKYREVIVLFYYEEFSIAEIAALLNEPQGTVKSKLHRARNRLRNLLEKEEGLCL
jgi:RNA polymerase sigma-70 factor (ECF subfamily)